MDGIASQPRWIGLCALFALVFLTGFANLRSEFISDDRNLILNRSDHFESVEGLQSILLKPYWHEASAQENRALFRPWSTFTFWVDYRLGGGKPFMFHLSNLLIHALNSVLICIALLPFTGYLNSLFVGALFGVSPAAFLSAGWISGRTDVWWLFFTLLLSISLLRALTVRRAVRWWLIAVVSYFLAMCSKEFGVGSLVLAGILVLPSLRSDPAFAVTARRRLYPLFLFLLPLASYFFIRKLALENAPLPSLSADTIGLQIPFFAEGMARNIFHVFVPLHSKFGSDFLWSGESARGLPFVSIWSVVILAVLWIGLGIFKRREWAFGALWSLAALSPAYLFGQAWMPVTFYYSYAAIPGLWLAVLFVFPVAERSESKDHSKYVFARYAYFALLLVYASVSVIRAQIFRNDLTLVNYMAEQEPRSASLLLSAATTHAEEGNFQRAHQLFEQAAAANPDDSKARRLVIEWYLNYGQLDLALHHAEMLERSGRTDAAAQATLGKLYFAAGNSEASLRYYRKSIELAAPDESVLFDYGMVLISSGQDEEGRNVYRDLVHRRPDWGQAFANLGVAEESLGNWSEAAQAYARAVELDSTLPVVHASLAIAYQRAGASRELVKETAIRYLSLESDAGRRARMLNAMIESGISLDSL